MGLKLKENQNIGSINPGTNRVKLKAINTQLIVSQL
ncbi:hypothetical protein P872_06365 [Rhodonellum psychrophilum GCM71 = DSM 17998]|uniref:Uncharacterized protein n=1 Tax=Rhodonellum psychrophilum GCM71 = DSM 17998 TaxID=1123057 RepID=U5BPY2_9BACT|nr:hypothetical protein P872_06365 [Rhodonellum psychrophilum GCM71 = DSM 17998]